MEERSYGRIQTLLWNLNGNGRKKLWPYKGIIVEFKMKWKEEVMAL